MLTPFCVSDEVQRPDPINHSSDCWYVAWIYEVEGTRLRNCQSRAVRKVDWCGGFTA